MNKAKTTETHSTARSAWQNAILQRIAYGLIRCIPWFLVLLCIVALSFIFRGKCAFARSVPEIVLSNRNMVTPASPVPDTYSRPEIFPRTNNLRRKAGSPFLARGTPLIIEGYVTDIMDVPIENARVQIWQANYMGFYNNLVDPEDDDKFDIDFLGAGTAITNNLGYYSFTTVMPGFYGHRTPHVHFIIHNDYSDSLETEMFFPFHPRNASDKEYSLMSQLHRELMTCIINNIDNASPFMGKKAVFNIRLDEIHPRKRY